MISSSNQEDFVFPDYLLENNSQTNNSSSFSVKIRLECDPNIWTHQKGHQVGIIKNSLLRLLKIIGVLLSSVIGISTTPKKNSGYHELAIFVNNSEQKKKNLVHEQTNFLNCNLFS